MSQNINVEGHRVVVAIKEGAWFFKCPSLNVEAEINIEKNRQLRAAIKQFFNRNMMPVLINKKKQGGNDLSFDESIKNPFRLVH